MILVTLPIKTVNPLNGSAGNSRLAGMLRAKRRKEQRLAAHFSVSAALLKKSCYYNARPLPLPAVTVTVTRIAPSNGLDPHDGLGAALKGVIDGVADALGFKNDRDERLTWVLKQRRGQTYGVEIRIERRAEEKTG